MSERKMTEEEIAEARIWRMTLARNEAVRALDRLLELVQLWPEEAKRLDVFGLESKMNAIREACRAD